jgi:hypothetical protein
MSMSDVKDVSRFHDARSTIFHGSRSLPGYHHANVLHLTKGTPGKWGDVVATISSPVRMLPGQSSFADLDEFESSFFKSA